MSKDRDDPRPPDAPSAPSDVEDAVSVGRSGELIVPAGVLRTAGISPGQDVVVEATPHGVQIVRDSLRKVHLEITSHCNLDCAMCVRHGWQEPLGDMPLPRFARLVEGLPGGPDQVTLAFSGFGEPLAHPDWPEMMERAREHRLRVELISNGLLIDAEGARRLVDLGVAQVTVSIDGGDEAAQKRMRGISATDAVAAVHHLLDARRHTRRPMALGVASVLTRSTVASLPALLDWANELRLDFVSIGSIVPHTEEMAREILWERAGWASVFKQSSWRPQVRVGRFDMEGLSRPLASALATQGLTCPPPWADELRWRDHCRFAHEGMCAVSWDGRVTPCLSLLHGHTEYINAQARRVNEYVVGHIDEQPLSTIWRNPSFRAFRQRLRAFDFPPCFHCGGCPLTETNDQDCYMNDAPVCGECLWAQGIVLCP